MYDLMRLKSIGGTTVVTLAAESFKKPYRKKESRFEVQTAALYIHEWGSKQEWTLDVRFLATTAHSTVVTWWDAKTSLSFIPDAETASTVSAYVRIINEENPLETFLWNEYYQGTLILREN